jgi:hypothetical protein
VPQPFFNESKFDALKDIRESNERGESAGGVGFLTKLLP